MVLFVLLTLPLTFLMPVAIVLLVAEVILEWFLFRPVVLFVCVFLKISG